MSPKVVPAKDGTVELVSSGGSLAMAIDSIPSLVETVRAYVARTDRTT